MIVRRWRASARDERRYLRHFRRRVLPELRRIRGFRGALVLWRRIAAGVEVEVLTLWDSLAAIRRFAGPHPKKAIVEPRARAALKRFERRVTHYQALAFDARTALGGGGPAR